MRRLLHIAVYLVFRVHLQFYLLWILLLDKLVPAHRMARMATPPRWWRPYRRLTVAQIRKAVRRSLRNPRHMKRRFCLRFGLSLYHFLRLAGRDAVVHFSLAAPALDPKRLHGHCWVSLNGKPVADPPKPETKSKILWQFPVDSADIIN